MNICIISALIAWNKPFPKYWTLWMCWRRIIYAKLLIVFCKSRKTLLLQQNKLTCTELNSSVWIRRWRQVKVSFFLFFVWSNWLIHVAISVHWMSTNNLARGTQASIPMNHSQLAREPQTQSGSWGGGQSYSVSFSSTDWFIWL